MCLLNPHDVLRNVGVGCPVVWEFGEESNNVGGFEAADGVCNVREEFEGRDEFLERVLAAESDVVDLVEGVQEKLAAAMRCGGNAELVHQTGGSEGHKLPLFPRLGVLLDLGVVLVEEVFVLPE